jgi:hypothetical protein
MWLENAIAFYIFWRHVYFTTLVVILQQAQLVMVVALDKTNYLHSLSMHQHHGNTEILSASMQCLVF